MTDSLRINTRLSSIKLLMLFRCNHIFVLIIFTKVVFEDFFNYSWTRRCVNGLLMKVGLRPIATLFHVMLELFSLHVYLT